MFFLNITSAGNVYLFQVQNVQ